MRIKIAMCDDNEKMLPVIAGAARSAFHAQGINADIVLFTSGRKLLASLEDYLYTAEGSHAYIHLYAGGFVSLEINGKTVGLNLETNYPWEGRVAVMATADVPVTFTLHLRVPGWCRRYSLEVNGEALDAAPGDGYIAVERTWRSGDRLTLDMDMPVRLVRANPRVREDAGKLAVARGPLVYCLEEADNGPDLHLLRLGGATSEAFDVQWKPEKLGGIVELSCPGLREQDEGWADELYRDDCGISAHPARLTFIPYYTWANREEGEMRVWVRE